MLGAGGEEEGEDDDVRRGNYDPRGRKGGRKLSRKVLVKKRRGEDMGVMGMKGSSPHVIVKRLGKAAEVVPYSPPGGNVITYSNTKNTVIPDANTVIPLAPSKRRGGGRALPNSPGRRRGGGRRRILLDLPEETRRSSRVQGREEVEEGGAEDSIILIDIGPELLTGLESQCLPSQNENMFDNMEYLKQKLFLIFEQNHQREVFQIISVLLLPACMAVAG